MDQQIRELELVRLIDGRMPADERALFLEWIDQQPEAWREVALAFVEEQVLRAELANPTVVALKPNSASSESVDCRWTLPNVAVAAMVAMMFGTLSGWWLARGVDGANSVASDPQQVSSPSSVYCVVLQSQPDAVAQEAAIAWRQMVQSLRQPVVSAEMREQMRQQGYLVREEPVLYVSDSDDGGQRLVPQRNVTLVAQQ